MVSQASLPWHQRRWVQATAATALTLASPVAMGLYVGYTWQRTIGWRTGSKPENAWDNFGNALAFGAMGVGLTVLATMPVAAIKTQPHAVASSDVAQLVEVYDKPAGEPGLAWKADVKSLETFTLFGVWSLAFDQGVPRRPEIVVHASYGKQKVECTWALPSEPAPGQLALPSVIPTRTILGSNHDVHDPNRRATLIALCRQEYAKNPLTYLQH